MYIQHRDEDGHVFLGLERRLHKENKGREIMLEGKDKDLCIKGLHDLDEECETVLYGVEKTTKI